MSQLHFISESAQCIKLPSCLIQSNPIQNPNLGYIDLSKRRVSAEDVEKCTERYAKAKAVNSILRHVADILKFETDEQLEDLYQKTAWHFEEKYKSKAAAYDVFKQAVIDPSILDECGLEEKTREVLLNNIRRKLTSQAVKIRADIECACYEYEGIDAVKEALRAGLETSTEELPIKINLIAPPLYGKCVCAGDDDDDDYCIKWLVSDENSFSFCFLADSNDHINARKSRWIESPRRCNWTDSWNDYQAWRCIYGEHGGKCKCGSYYVCGIENNFSQFSFVSQKHTQPKVVTATDEADLARRMERAEAENAEVDGDEEDENEDGMTFNDGENGNDDKDGGGSSEEEEEKDKN